jgi:hypothetical protein
MYTRPRITGTSLEHHDWLRLTPDIRFLRLDLRIDNSE